MGNKPWVVVFLCCVVLGFSSGVALGEGNEEALVLEPDAEGIQRAFIVLDSYAYAPSHISVQAGVPVEFQLENQSFLTPHNFIIDYPDAGLQHNRQRGCRRQCHDPVRGADPRNVHFLL